MSTKNVVYCVTREHLTWRKFPSLVVGFDRGCVSGAIERYKVRRGEPSICRAWHGTDALIDRANASKERADL